MTIFIVLIRLVTTQERPKILTEIESYFTQIF